MKYRYDDDCSIELGSSDKVIITIQAEKLEFNEEGKPKFNNNLGESVVEYSGLVVDENQLRSWAKANYKPNGYSELHFHTERTEDYYIISGHGKIILDDQEIALLPGVHLRVLPGQHHQVINTSDEEELGLIVKCSPSWIAEDMHLVVAKDEISAIGFHS